MLLLEKLTRIQATLRHVLQKALMKSMNLSLEGIGATLQSEDDETSIKSLVPGAPAERSKKLQAGDKIIGVGQEKGEIEDIIGWRLEDIVDKIKGKKGTKVRLEIEPAKGGKKPYCHFSAR